MLWKHTLGTIGRGAPVFADGKIFATEEVGRLLIVQPGPDGAKTLHLEQLTVPDGRFAEIWGSVAVAYGRLYFTTEEGLYCVGKKGAPFKATASKRSGGSGPAAGSPTRRRRASPSFPPR